MEKSRSEIQPSISRIDRISSLPDEILCHILSFLSTKYAVATSILSHRWTDIWTRIPVLHFYDEHYHTDDDDDKMAFMGFVDKVMSRNSSPNIEKFQFWYTDHSGINLSRINDLLQTAMSRKVVELDLRLHFTEINDETALRLLPCNSLEVLRIDAEVRLQMPSSGCFKNLKKFHIQLLDNADNELTSKLFSSLPQLEELNMLLGDMTYCTDLNIAAPVLKLLDIKLWGKNFDDIPDLKVLIDAPMLEYISLRDDFLASYTFKDLSSNVQAKIGVGGYTTYDYDGGFARANLAIKLIWGLSSVKYLSISESTMNAITIAYADNVPMFRGLTKVQLFVGPSMWNLLLHFLKSAPNLEILVLEIEGNMNLDMEREQECIMPETCSMLHLKEVEINGIGMTKGFQFLKFISQNAKALKKFTVNSVVFS